MSQYLNITKETLNIVNIVVHGLLTFAVSSLVLEIARAHTTIGIGGMVSG